MEPSLTTRTGIALRSFSLAGLLLWCGPLDWPVLFWLFFSFFFFLFFFLFRLQLKRSFLISRSAIRFPSISLFLPIFLLIESYSLLILSPIHIPIPFLIVFEVPWDRQQPSAKREGEGRYTLSFPKDLLEKSTRNRTHSRRSVTAGGGLP